MAPVKEDYPLMTLRSVTYRIQSTSPSHLPAIVPHLAAVLPSCKSVLSAPQTSGGKDASEAAVLVHKFRTKLSTLLQDRSIEGRWSAVVLIKAAIELGGWEMLQKSKPWVTGLLGILSKPDPSTTKILTIIALTRIFMLTRDFQTLVREITTPSLPPFITKCLSILEDTKWTSGDSGVSRLQSTIIESFTHLITRHPTIFRTHCSRIKQRLAVILVAGATVYPADGLAAARKLFIQLTCCAPKNGAQGEWDKTFNALTANAHQTADKVFRAVIEEWESSTGVKPSLNSAQVLDDEPQQQEPDLCGLPAWSGIYAGSDRLISMIKLLEAAAITSTASGAPVNIKISNIMDLLTRILSVTAPGMSLRRKNQNSDMALNDQIGKAERSALWIVLPDIHAAAIDFFGVLVERLSIALTPVIAFFQERLMFIFQEEKLSEQVRKAVYRVLGQILPITGPTMTAAQVKNFHPVMISCCEDLLPRDKDAANAQPTVQKPANGAGKAPQATMNADTFLGSATKIEQSVNNGTRHAAWALLPIFLTQLPSQLLENSMRSRIESTAVLIQHKEALLASVLNMSPTKIMASLLPLLARLFPEAPEVEALLRPRMPVLKKGTFDDAVDNVDDEEDDEDDEEESERQSDAGAIGQSNDAEKGFPAADIARAIEPEEQYVDQALTAATVNPVVEVASAETGLGKRTSVDPAPQAPSPKRARLVETASSSNEKDVTPVTTATTTAGAIEEDDDDDDDVEIPTLIMDQDEESEGEE
ncbi:hypothetical protein K490DRAFT_74142 [Saccharata proteae CBS 121410]|uniref:Pre-rRNA-processing protein RIX1 n=1 Tax=Saccharata proteae CBS 121410 TaxID=1314787 RepID=A0A9P4HUZ7_9PEZI|nr:hypothetical protein K490DRAFT_74142 [Saccharata proteae CBS 121410]